VPTCYRLGRHEVAARRCRDSESNSARLGRSRAHIIAAIEEAREEGVSILCLPELCITGYGCEDAFLSPGTQAMALSALDEILSYAQGIVVRVGLPLFHNKALFNTSALIVDGKLIGFVAKRALSGDGIHYEPRWFKPWPAGKRTLVSVLGQAVPLGDIFFDCSGIRLGFEIWSQHAISPNIPRALRRVFNSVGVNSVVMVFVFVECVVGSECVRSDDQIAVLARCQRNGQSISAPSAQFVESFAAVRGRGNISAPRGVPKCHASPVPRSSPRSTGLRSV